MYNAKKNEFFNLNYIFFIKFIKIKFISVP